MSQARIVFCTCSNDEQAVTIARSAVEARLPACVNVLPPVRSIYRWEGTIETANEVLMLIKTTQDRVAELEALILRMHNYELPEFVAVAIAEGSDKYLSWLTQNV